MRAVRGERSTYRAIRSPLCESSEPVPVARRLTDYARSNILYIADLDAITGGEAQDRVLAALLDELPHLHLWIDGGFPDLAALRRLRRELGARAGRITPVFASESLTSPDAARDCLADTGGSILSLDRRGDTVMDRARCWDNASIWPARVIVMTLDRVGAFAGPDLHTLGEVARRAPGTTLIGAGGIRDADDLDRAAAAGAHAWLIASALHDLRISPAA